jgi:hypothetical protein
LRAWDRDHPFPTDQLYGRCTIEKIDGTAGFKVFEEALGPRRATAEKLAYISGSLFYEGILFFFKPVIFVLLRNNLTRLPRVYWLQRTVRPRR